MKIFPIVRVVAMIFVMVTALLLVLAVVDVIDTKETREAVLKAAAVCGIIAATSVVLTFLGNNKS